MVTSKETYGVPVEEIVEAIKYGVRKVNIDTDLRLASTGAIRRFLAQNRAEFDPRKYLKENRYRDARHLYRSLRSFWCCWPGQQDADLAGKMSDKYAKGELAQVITAKPARSIVGNKTPVLAGTAQLRNAQCRRCFCRQTNWLMWPSSSSS